MNDIIHVTDHAKKRALQRFYMTPERLSEFAYKAFTEGYSYNDAPSKEIKRYLKGRIEYDRNLYVYSGYVFVFEVDKRIRLITAFRMPKYYLNTI